MKRRPPRYRVQKETETGTVLHSHHEHTEQAAEYWARKWAAETNIVGRIYRRRYSVYLHHRSFDNDD